VPYPGDEGAMEVEFVQNGVLYSYSTNKYGDQSLSERLMMDSLLSQDLSRFDEFDWNIKYGFPKPS